MHFIILCLFLPSVEQSSKQCYRSKQFMLDLLTQCILHSAINNNKKPANENLKRFHLKERLLFSISCIYKFIIHTEITERINVGALMYFKTYNFQSITI